MTEIRLHDLPAGVEAFAAALAASDRFQVVSTSADYPDRRGTSDKVRRYLDVRLRPGFDGELTRLAARVLRGGDRYRVVCTDSESPDGIALVCTDPAHPAEDREQQWGVYDCCDTDVIETHSEAFAAFVVAALDWSAR